MPLDHQRLFRRAPLRRVSAMSAGTLSLLPATCKQCGRILSGVPGLCHSRKKRREQIGESPVYATHRACSRLPSAPSDPRVSARAYSELALSSDRFSAQGRSANLDNFLFPRAWHVLIDDRVVPLRKITKEIVMKIRVLSLVVAAVMFLSLSASAATALSCCGEASCCDGSSCCK